MNCLFDLSGKTIFGLQNQGMLKSTKERMDRQAQRREEKMRLMSLQKMDIHYAELFLLCC